MKDIDTCQHGLKPECPQITHPIMAHFIGLIENLAITVDSINEINELCEDCNSFTPKE